jgi:lipid A 3-O-deacylase
MNHHSIGDHTVRPSLEAVGLAARVAGRRSVMQKGRRWRVLGLLFFVVGSAAPVAWAEAPANSDTRARIEFYSGAAQMLDQGDHPWNVGLSYIWRPMGRWGIAPGVGAMVAEHGASAFYGELRKDFWLGRQWVVTPKFAAGVYHNGSGVDLGNELEFREGLVLSWVGPRLRLGVGFYHASNGGLGENNPGTEVLEVVLDFPFGTTSE